MSKRKSSTADVDRVRKLLGVIVYGVLAVILLGGLLYSFGVFDSSDDQYEIIAGAQPPAANEQVRVAEFFSYGCVHCKDFEPDVHRWAGTVPDYVTFEGSPVTFGNPTYRFYANTYFALKEMNALDKGHRAIFDAIHSPPNRRLSTPDEMSNYLSDYGVDAVEFRRALNAPRVRRELDRSEREEREYMIQATPSLVVGGYYRINVGVTGRPGALRLADQLIARIRSGEVSASPAAVVDDPGTPPAPAAPATNVPIDVPPGGAEPAPAPSAPSP